MIKKIIYVTLQKYDKNTLIYVVFMIFTEKFPRTNFLKQKDSRKQELALGILLIG